MSGQRVVQLSAGSLAIVLSSVEPAQEEPAGSAVFRGFQAANARCVWEPRLVRAVSELSLLGWLQNGVLLVRGQSLEVLRDAWSRRALRPPAGYKILALGDVSAMHMNLVCQSQFVPLAEVLCCAISDMNAAQVLVTQESLMDQLISHYPGSKHNIAYMDQRRSKMVELDGPKSLFNLKYYVTMNCHPIKRHPVQRPRVLIKERKIYHTGEGYFIVTPQTYFITKTSAVGSAGVGDDIHSPPSITYLVSMESCADLTKDNGPSVSHCRSCSCFSELSAQNILGQQSINESNLKGLRSVKESKLPLHNKATSTAADRCTYVKPKEKEKCAKKFGIGLFWRNASRKEKSRKERVNFSSQFPPEEWPVRDEDNLDNIPRDVEHEIIKRINPVLTVDNLMRHTVLMQKAESQKKCFSKGTSTDIVKNKHRHSVRGSSRKKSSRISRYHKSTKEKNKRESCAPRSEISAHGQGDGVSIKLNAVDDPMVQDEVQPDVVYKKQISNPFVGLPYKESNKGVKPGEVKRSASGKHRKRLSGMLERSRSLAVDISTKCPNEGHVDGYNKDLFHDQVPPLIPDKDDLREYPPNYPQCTTLRIDEKYKQNKETNVVHNQHEEDQCPTMCNNPRNTFLPTENIQQYDGVGSHSKWTYTNKLRPIPSESQSTQINHSKNLTGLKNIILSQNDEYDKIETVKQERHSGFGLNNVDLPKYKGFSNSDHEGLTDDDQTLYQKAVDEEDDVCSSLYLEDDTDENVDLCPTLQSHVQKTSREQLSWTDLQEEHQGEPEQSQDNWGPDISLMSRLTCVDHNKERYNVSGSSLSSSQGYDKPALHPKSCSVQLLPQYGHKHPEAEADAQCTPVSDVVDGSIFDYCNSSDGNSVADAIQITVNEEKLRDSEPQSGEMRRCFEHKLKLFNPLDTNHCEKNESHSTTGDSGFESPRTRISLASNNSIIMDRLKRRTFLQSLEMHSNPKNEGLLSTSSLMQRTPVMKV